MAISAKNFAKVRFSASVVRNVRPLRKGRGRFLLAQVFDNASIAGKVQERTRIAAAAAWLGRAQDSQADGGIAGRYRLRTGWSSSYPETTGYIIPTLLALRAEFGDDEFLERARRAVHFLLAVQLPSGAFPGLEIAQNVAQASAFNTAQIIHGLIAWNREVGDPAALKAALRAGEWLVSIQDTEGSWTKFTYEGVAADYSAHLACWLAELGEHTGDRLFLDSAQRHLDWVLRHFDPATSWFEHAGFSRDQHLAGEAFTHTIAYTIWGVLCTSEILRRRDGKEAALRAAHAVARRLEISKWLPSVLDARYRGRSRSACLTGNCQMALIWFRLYELTNNAVLLNAALKALDLVKRTQDINNPDPGIRGGIAGSYPIWGEYIRYALPNWGAKYFIDALLAKKGLLDRLSNRMRGDWQPPPDLPQSLPPCVSDSTTPAQSIVLLTHIGSQKVPKLLEAWKSWCFEPKAVIVERGKSSPITTRLLKVVIEEGVAGIWRRIGAAIAARGAIESAHDRQRPDSVLGYCARHGIRAIEITDLNDINALRRIEAIKPDLLVHAGAGLIRPPVMSIPRLGIINAHMGLLPRYRGMNVAEWSAFNGDPIGSTVQMIDRGIDTGDILLVRIVDAAAARDIDTLRSIVDASQIELLGTVLRYIEITGELPRRRPQKPEEGCQFFVMHQELRAILERELFERSAEARFSGTHQ